MDKSIKAAILIVILGLLSAMLLAGCDTSGGGGADQVSEPSPEAPSLPTAPPVYSIPEFPLPSASGTNVEENDKATIDFSNMSDGYVMARFREDTNGQIRAILNYPDGTEYTYRLTSDGDFGVFPLSGGNGEYGVRVFEQIDGSRYALALSATIDVVLTDEFAPFLRPNQFVDFNRDSEAVRKAAELAAGVDGLMDIVSVIYHFVTTNIEYDFELAQTVQSGYVPDVDNVLMRGRGICFDFASVMAAMLRSQGIPTKLVIGYVGEAYHAWISVFSAETGWIDDIISFDGVHWTLMDPTFASSANPAEMMSYIGDGTNYRPMFMH